MLKKTFILLLYGAYALALIAILLVVLFPRDRVLLWVTNQIEQELPGFRCRIERVGYVHPLKIRLDQIVLENRTELIDVRIDNMLADFEFKWPIEGFHLSAAMYGGVVESEVELNFEDREVELNELAASSIRLGEIDFLEKRLDRQFNGALSMAGQMSVRGGTSPAVRFDGSLKIHRFTTKLRRPILGIAEIDMDEVSSDVVFGPESIDLTAGRFTGELLGGDFSGRIMLQNPWQASKIDIVGNLAPDEGLVRADPQLTEPLARLYRRYQREAIPCLVGGTLEEPQFRFGT